MESERQRQTDRQSFITDTLCLQLQLTKLTKSKWRARDTDRQTETDRQTDR